VAVLADVALSSKVAVATEFLFFYYFLWAQNVCGNNVIIKYSVEEINMNNMVLIIRVANLEIMSFTLCC
jgi:hypothetical protein